MVFSFLSFSLFPLSPSTPFFSSKEQGGARIADGIMVQDWGHGTREKQKKGGEEGRRAKTFSIQTSESSSSSPSSSTSTTPPPKVFSPENVMYRKPSMSLCSS
jgi:hypothetical protein